MCLSHAFYVHKYEGIRHACVLMARSKILRLWSFRSWLLCSIDDLSVNPNVLVFACVSRWWTWVLPSRCVHPSWNLGRNICLCLARKWLLIFITVFLDWRTFFVVELFSGNYEFFFSR